MVVVVVVVVDVFVVVSLVTFDANISLLRTSFLNDSRNPESGQCFTRA